jgi:lipopolysaccharide/colanic/teichoic acid biosynthesis glycosyltransferase
MAELSETVLTYRSKRALDLLVAIVALALAAPVMGVIAICVRLTSSGPAIHRATRAGRDGTPFTLYKFRSMRTTPGVVGSLITAAGDDRITRVGRVLRTTKLDELPQLVNVVRGEMSIVGPRPEDPSYASRYTDEQRRILAWRPGLTSPASIEYRHEEAILQSAPDLESAYAEIADAKLRLDLDYFPTSSLRGDLAIMMKTLRSIFT